MSKKDDLIARVNGSTGGEIPVGFWLHFNERYGKEAAQAHVDFIQQTGVDFVKMMNEHPYPSMHDLSSVDGWKNFKPVSMKDPWVQEQLDVVKRTTDLLGDDVVVLYTIFGPVAAAYHAGRGANDVHRGDGPVGGPDGEADRLNMADHLREDPELVGGVFNMLSDVAAELAAASLEAGAQGIYYSAWGGEQGMFTDEEFDRHIRPNDFKVLGAVSEASSFNVLHICKPNTKLERYRDYPAQVVNWASHANSISLEEGRAYFPDQTLLGGIDNSDLVLNGGTAAEIEALVHETISALSSTDNFILGADCALNMSTPYANLKAASDAAKSFQK